MVQREIGLQFMMNVPVYCTRYRDAVLSLFLHGGFVDSSLFASV